MFLYLTSYTQPQPDSTTKLTNSTIYLGFNTEGANVSLHYGKLLRRSKHFFLTAEAGLGYYINPYALLLQPLIGKKQYVYLMIPHHITANFGGGKHYLEVGVGGSIVAANVDKNYWLYGIVGYRMQPFKSKKFMMRVFCNLPTTDFELSSKDVVFLPAGFSLGISL
jgi:hypothetical protein